MRVLKLLAYGLIGYAMYELVRQIAGEEASAAGERRRRVAPEPRAPQRGPRMTGPGGGTSTDVADSSGAWHRQSVGRGVV